jgi:hypothetical protein
MKNRTIKLELNILKQNALLKLSLFFSDKYQHKYRCFSQIDEDVLINRLETMEGIE